MAMTEEEIFEIHCVCYYCGERNGRATFWVDAQELVGLTMCINCANALDVEDIDEMPCIPIPVEEWFSRAR